MARALVIQGAAKVYILGRRLEVLETAAKEHPNLIPHRCDVTSKEDLQAIVDRVTKEVGYVNLVVANSGILGPSVRYNPSHSVSELRKTLFTDFSMEEMTEVLNVNITAAFFTMSAFLELLDAGNKNALKGGFGRPDKEGSDVVTIQSQVIFTSSISAFSRHYASTPPYLASKTAIMQLTKQASSQLGRHGIRANGMAPGCKYTRWIIRRSHWEIVILQGLTRYLSVFPSDIAAGLIGDRKPENEGPDDARFIPARRFGGDEEMTGAILYLASRSGSYCNGSILVTDGGRLSLMPGTY